MINAFIDDDGGYDDAHDDDCDVVWGDDCGVKHLRQQLPIWHQLQCRQRHHQYRYFYDGGLSQQLRPDVKQKVKISQVTKMIFPLVKHCITKSDYLFFVHNYRRGNSWLNVNLYVGSSLGWR